jgi:hypothetical protein
LIIHATHQAILSLHALLHLIHQARQATKLLRQGHNLGVQAQAGQATGTCPGLGHRLNATQLLPLCALRILLQALSQCCLVFLLIQQLLVHLVYLLPPCSLLSSLLSKSQLHHREN